MKGLNQTLRLVSNTYQESFNAKVELETVKNLLDAYKYRLKKTKDTKLISRYQWEIQELEEYIEELERHE